MNPIKGFLGLIFGGGLLALSACASDESINREANLELKPYDAQAEPVVGEEFHGFDKGEPQTTKVLDVKDGFITLTNTTGPRQGCTWTRGIEKERFAPAVSWSNCSNGSTGTQEYTKSGNIWPLSVGNEESYKITGSDQKNTWQTVRRCRVEDAVQVTVQGKQFPAYEVVCRDDWSVRTWYISPDLKRTIKFKRIHKDRGVQNDWVTAL